MTLTESAMMILSLPSWALRAQAKAPSYPNQWTQKLQLDINCNHVISRQDQSFRESEELKTDADGIHHQVPVMSGRMVSFTTLGGVFFY